MGVDGREGRRHADLTLEGSLERERAVRVLPEAALGDDVVEAREDKVIPRLGRRLK